MFKVLNCIANEHDLRLVALSAAICALGCFTTTTLMARAQAAGSRLAMAWLVAAAAVFGSSVWSLHFVAMLAFMPSQAMGYSVDLTVASILVAMGGALLALLAWKSTLSPWFRLAISGAVLGLSVTGMHYVGVAAMSFSGLLFLDRLEVAASVAISIVLSVVALVRSSSLAAIGRRIEVTVWLALAICGLHFTGMAAMTMTPGVGEEAYGVVLGTSTFAAIVGTVSLGLLLISLAAVLVEQHLSQRALKELAGCVSSAIWRTRCW